MTESPSQALEKQLSTSPVVRERAALISDCISASY